jgi:hypothetical protein
MGFLMTESEGFFVPAAVCDHCGREVGADGLILWDIASARPLTGQRMLVACDDACVDELAGTSDDAEAEWVAVALDAYLAGLVERLSIEPAAVLERERAAAAMEETRREGPE